MSYDDDPTIADVPGEPCTYCAELLGERGYLAWWHDNSDAIGAFEAFCHESGSQDHPPSHNALPAAIARKRGDAVEVELLGPVRATALDADTPIDGGGAEDPMWSDPRALDLYEQVCAAPRRRRSAPRARRLLARTRDAARRAPRARARRQPGVRGAAGAPNARPGWHPLGAIVPVDTGALRSRLSLRRRAVRRRPRASRPPGARLGRAAARPPRQRLDPPSRRCARCASSARINRGVARGSRRREPTVGDRDTRRRCLRRKT